ncbi:MAG: hypothetical protein QOF41_2347 [Methylobacteriaceae bacterium]|nr:hypothetical protein [Methylobacteriaceae bacterium]
MTYITSISNIARSQGDPKVLSSGPGSLDNTDRLARALGWFSIGLGLTELLAPRALTRWLGIEGSETLVRAYGMREIGAGIMTLSPDKGLGLQSRVAGDALDIATLLSAMRSDNPKRDNVAIALAMVVGVTLLDIAGATGVKKRQSRSDRPARTYRDRSGYPQGLERARGAARDFRTPPDMRAIPMAANRESRAAAE